MHPQVIIRSFRQAVAVAIQRIREIAVTIDKKNPEKLRELLQRCAATTLSSKVHGSCDGSNDPACRIPERLLLQTCG